MNQICIRTGVALLSSAALLMACGDDLENKSDTGALPSEDVGVEDLGVDTEPDVQRDPAPEADGIYGFAHGCYAVEAFDGREARFLHREGERFAFVEGEGDAAAKFHMRAADLGTYLFYDTERGFWTADEDAGTGSGAGSDAGSGTATQFQRVERLTSAVELLDDLYISPAEWGVEVSVSDPTRFQLRHLASDQFLTFEGLTPDPEQAAVVAFFPREGCAEFPELSLDATGTVEPRTWEDGELFGYAEIHSHITTNFGFGGGNMFHGAPFHRLGVEHALGSCEASHGVDGRGDLIGLFYDSDIGLDLEVLLPIMTEGQASEPNHATDGYPTFSEWPNGWAMSTHQVMYYRGIERAYMSGLRLIMQHATGNSVLCEFVEGLTAHETLYGCNDMVSVDRSIQEMRDMERYIDAQSGGPGEGWLRIVTSPAEAREVISQGKLAIILGIEISNIFDCFLTPPEGFERCTEEDVLEKLDRYHELGVRVLFPVHKFDNGFSAGDGSDGVIELGNLISSGHYTNKVEDCPLDGAPFDHGGVTFGGLNQPRDEYDAEPVLNMRNFARDPVGTLLPIVGKLQEPALSGTYCQNAGMTELGETLLLEMMKRGMLPDIAHLPQRGLVRALEMLEENEYPALATHGRHLSDRMYSIGGMHGTGFSRCGATDGTQDTMGDGFRARYAQRASAGFSGAEGFAFDANGFAGAPRPRFGENSRCPQPQANPVEYPFTSYDGNVVFHQPYLGERQVDFNTEGMIHFGLIPEYIEDARRDGMSDEDLEPLFRSAESVIQMWELAEARGAILRGE